MILERRWLALAVVVLAGCGGTNAGGEPDGGDAGADGGDAGADAGDAGADAGTCGGDGEDCCASDTCDSSLVCDDGTCVVCGIDGALCCDSGDACGADLECFGGTCECGAFSQVCCGGTTCDDDLTCTDDACDGDVVVLASGQTQPFEIAVDNGVVYWTNSHASGTVNKVSRTGGAPTTVATDQHHPRAIAVGGGFAYWTNYDPEHADEAVMRAATDGTGLTTLASGVFVDEPTDIALSGSTIYWTNYGKARVMTVPAAGGDALPDTSSPGSLLLGVAANATYVYWTDNRDPGSVQRRTIGAGLDVIATVHGAPAQIAVTDTQAFWTNQAGDQVVIFNHGGGGVVVNLPAGSAPFGITADSTWMWWTNQFGGVSGEGIVSGIPISGGSIQTVTDLHNPTGIAMDDQYVYFTETGAGKVWRYTR